MHPNPDLIADGPLEVIEAKTILHDDAGPNRKGASLARLDSGRLLMAFSQSAGRNSLESSLMLSHSDDSGST